MKYDIAASNLSVNAIAFTTTISTQYCGTIVIYVRTSHTSVTSTIHNGKLAPAERSEFMLNQLNPTFIQDANAASNSSAVA